MKIRVTIVSLLMVLAPTALRAQITIGGNVYGGGNEGKVDGSTSVTVRQGDIDKVFGGARMADVGGNAYVNIDGKQASGYIVINYVYGGNDISGHIGTAAAVGEALPAELTGNPDGVDNTWNTYVHLSSKTKQSGEVDPTNNKVYIGQLFGGGNGAYDYVDNTNRSSNETTYSVYQLPRTNGDQPITKDLKEYNIPELAKTYVDVQGGSIVYAYGGGNNATVTDRTVIHVDNPSKVVNHIYVDDNGKEVPGATEDSHEGATDLLTTERFKDKMGINTVYSFPSSDEFQIGRFFGGNNMATMDIMPTWNLQSGKIRNLYSGGNRGMMTNPNGLLLEIPATSEIVVDNVFGGCRMADVMPLVKGVYTPVNNDNLNAALGGNYKFPNELSARVLIRGGNINNVYGGNDVTGNVYGGNAIGIYTTIRGDVYGGGNGAYPYTDNQDLANDEVYGDFYYTLAGYSSRVAALNGFRPNAEQVSIRLKGTKAKPTVIQGSVYVGGNCASLTTKKSKPTVELKIGSYVMADKVFLGNNGEKMVDPKILSVYADKDINFSSLDFKNSNVFANYMEGVAMDLQPKVVFDKEPTDPETYIDNTSQIGSFYCGGNVGSMAIPEKNTYEVTRKLIIFDKFVAGCNNANVPASEYNAAYEGGVLGSSDERQGYTDEDGHIKDRIELNLNNLTIQPMRWNDTFEAITADDLEDGKLKAGETYYTSNLRSSEFVATGNETVDLSAANKYYKLTEKGTKLDWNTVIWDSDNEKEFVQTGTDKENDDEMRRLHGGNVYGGCYNSGHVNGNVVININEDLMNRDEIFAENTADDTHIMKQGGERRSGVLIGNQGDDMMPFALSVYGAGRGADTEIWGSTTVNLINGYAFQIFGGGEKGYVGKKTITGYTASGAEIKEYIYNKDYSSTVNLRGQFAGYSEKESGSPLAEAEYLYGGGNAGIVCGDTYVNLGNGRIYEAYGGSCNADILGATEVIIGQNGGFPWVRDNVFGGNDFGGTVRGEKDHTLVTSRMPFDASLLTSSTYVRYIQGRVDSIFGGCYGNYDYREKMYGEYTDDDGEPIAPFTFPHLDHNTFVHFQPVDPANNELSNKVTCILGGCEGYPGDDDMNNLMQEESYVLIDDTQTKTAGRFAKMDIYGGGAFAGMGHLGETNDQDALGAGRTVVDLFAGNFHNVYGASNKEGLIGYARVNVPKGSNVKVNALFGGGKGYDLAKIAAEPALSARYCDSYVTCVDFRSGDAIVDDGIYGGNENIRIACDTYINIEAPVMQSNGYYATIYGAGYGRKTVCGRTNVFMNAGSNAYKVFGGGRDGNAFNFPSMRRWLYEQFANLHGATNVNKINASLAEYNKVLTSFSAYIINNPIDLPENIGTYVNPETKLYDGTHTNDILPTVDQPIPGYHQTNVHIMPGGNVNGYAYGGGLGTDAVVDGSTYIELLGGIVEKDIYGGGQGGPVEDEFNFAKDNDPTNDYTVSTNVYIESGMARNVYGGGYLGHVGKHKMMVGNEEVDADISISYAGDILGVANVTIGKKDGTGYMDGIPAIQRNVYGGGEGGSVYGTSNLTINNGYIGYRCDNTGTEESPVYKYSEVVTDVKPNDFELGGNVFGGGYVVNSYVDFANVTLYGGTIRGSVYGGGEVGPIGRGTMKDGEWTTGLQNGNARIFKAGKTHIEMYNGLVKRNVFGGGRGKDSWGGDGTKFMHDNMTDEEFDNLDLMCKGFVFGQTDVNIYGGEVGTNEGMVYGYGNVFGGGDEGSVYSAYEEDGSLRVGMKSGERYKDKYQGYYYKTGEDNEFISHNVGTEESPKYERVFTEDCKVLVEPWLQVKTPITLNDGTTYQIGDYIPTSYLNTLGAKGVSGWSDEWDDVDVGEQTTDGFKERGVIIHNAVFAGGNIASGSSSMYANEKTVFGNATASIHDVYNRDLITIGTGHTGGLYGDGNLTFVDGYRELNITNYGTDYYHLATTLTYSEYLKLPKREQDYYEVKYKCINENGCTDLYGTTYTKGSTLPKDELIALFTKEDGTSARINDDGTLVTSGTGGTAVLVGEDIGQLEPNSLIWQENGVVSTYAGRIMNTIQRADFCGVFGSRMVMKGARDRVPEEVDYTNYTINRVREVSLNKMEKTDESNDNKLHGNYFGIYSIVNYLGALTSDVDFQSVRTTKANTQNNSDLAADGKTFAEWKATNINNKKRNNGNCHNQLALASGVYLELTTEQSTGNELNQKDWGLITGVVELDLINVQPGIGGGFVYAKNEHGERTPSGNINTTLTALNKDAATQWDYNYATADASRVTWETSGNFIHSSQTIVDDCYNESARYLSRDGVPAHYWFISGQVYVYDQYISAYTGAPNAYSKTVELPITINAASHGTMTLMDVQPNLYAYYSSYTNETTNTKLGGDRKLVINDVEYKLNDPISYWDWNKLSYNEKRLFKEETYVVTDSCYIGDTYYPAGYVMLPDEYDRLREAAVMKDLPDDDVDTQVKAVQKATVNANKEEMVVKDESGNDVYMAFEDAFHSSNNMSHDTGYLLTYNMTNPSIWKEWYTKVSSATREKNQTGFSEPYEDGPTYHPTADGLYGQHEYAVRDIISEEVYNTYQTALTTPNLTLSGQATFEEAYVTTDYIEVKNKVGTEQHVQAKSALVASDYAFDVWSSLSGKVAEAYVCTSTIKLADDNFIYVNDLLTQTEKNTYISNVESQIRKLRTTEKLSDERLAAVTKIEDLTAAEKEGLTDDQLKTLSELLTLRTDLNKNIVRAYYCTEEGFYGGDYYKTSTNYRALNAWSSMSEKDRLNFEFNYDALDLLIDPSYGTDSQYGNSVGRRYQYDGKHFTEKTQAEGNAAGYSLTKPIDYTATYNGTANFTYKDAGNNSHTVEVGDELQRVVYEALPNEQRHYAAIKVDAAGTYYVVNTDFVHIETPYAVGATIDSEAYGRLTNEEKEYVTELTFTSDDILKDASGNPLPFYYCREEYIVNEKGEGQSVTPMGSTTPYTAGQKVPVGTVIKDSYYKTLPNRQKNFTIHGVSPMETSTLYVSRNSDINDLSTEKIITVIYKYDYEESDADGLHITPVSERHVVNIHVTFESGVPSVADIQAPTIVLPGTSITMKTPRVQEGAYEVLGGGWELFEKTSDAESHTNGVEYEPSKDPLYWYQDGFYLAYYAKTYLGKTYSNAVQVSVANYHDLKAVMNDKNHLHVDYDRTRLQRDSKIYINDYTTDDPATSQNGLDLLKDFYDLSLLTSSSADVTNGVVTAEGRLNGQSLLNNSEATGINMYDHRSYVKGVKAGNNLEFFLRTDIDRPSTNENPWTPIGDDSQCFMGTLHGDGYTISGLDHSLFENLCGSVYNLGVTGSFTSAGVVDKGTGYVESAWVKSDATSSDAVSKPYAVFGNPTDTKGYQVVNSYFWDGNNALYNTSSANGVTTSGGVRGKARAMTTKEFYNGTVAYDLNNFYLHKRYSNMNGSVVSENTDDRYYTIGDNGQLVLQSYKTYADSPDLCSSGYTYTDNSVPVTIKYVEDRIADGDYRFAGGTIPSTEDERYHVETVTDSDGNLTQNSHFYPIWPDDYLFFGQRLTYSYAMEAHQDVPTAVVKDAVGRLAQTKSNRVYRAPAYFRSKQMGVAHFNPDAYLAQTENPETVEEGKEPREAYPGMTAIDFAGHQEGLAASAFKLGTQTSGFYPPLLDDDGLKSIVNEDETPNLLVYAPAANAESGYANEKTCTVLNSYFEDPDYNSYYSDDPEGYRLVGKNTTSVNGHLVQYDLTATNDHLLVDKHDFNAPIRYSFDGNHRMWYQRLPDSFVDIAWNNETRTTKGWEGLSIPFQAELVTTDQKGEITHFYKNPQNNGYNDKYDSGHEYWLREFSGIRGTSGDVATANLVYPTGLTGEDADAKIDKNTFLWDYYYSANRRAGEQAGDDANHDVYQKDYYAGSRNYPGYPLLSGATAYIIGFPGSRYYEFDLSGTFVPANTASTTPAKLEPQTVTFASNTGVSILVSDDEPVISKDGFTFKPNYLNEKLTSVSADAAADVVRTYALNADGNAYTAVVHAADAAKFKVAVDAFRPYFMAPTAATRTIVFDNEPDETKGGEEHGDPRDGATGTLRIYTNKNKIYVESSLSFTEDVRIVTPAGITVAAFAVNPGQTVEVKADFAGMYVVHTLDGLYVKKVVVKRE